MGWFDYFSDLAGSLTIQDASAEQPRGQDEDAPTKGGASVKSPASGTDEESSDEAAENEKEAQQADERADEDEDGEAAGGDGEDAEEEEEEDDDDEPKDPKDVFEEECKATKCASLKHHYDECAERVQKQIDDGGKAQEDCVEESHQSSSVN